MRKAEWTSQSSINTSKLFGLDTSIESFVVIENEIQAANRGSDLLHEVIKQGSRSWKTMHEIKGNLYRYPAAD